TILRSRSLSVSLLDRIILIENEKTSKLVDQSISVKPFKKIA
ncbi:MAG: hypothetical protein ACI9A7_001467, partial [Cyclobacteriaceae bacterium]